MENIRNLCFSGIMFPMGKLVYQVHAWCAMDLGGGDDEGSPMCGRSGVGAHRKWPGRGNVVRLEVVE
jgi:hypothetical protein